MSIHPCNFDLRNECVAKSISTSNLPKSLKMSEIVYRNPRIWKCKHIMHILIADILKLFTYIDDEIVTWYWRNRILVLTKSYTVIPIDDFVNTGVWLLQYGWTISSILAKVHVYRFGQVWGWNRRFQKLGMVLEIYLDIGSIIKQSYKISTQVSLLGPSFFCMQLSYDPVNLRFLTVPL